VRLLACSWTDCLAFNADGSCSQPAPRAPGTNAIVPSPTKFPNGFSALTAQAHSLVRLGSARGDGRCRTVWERVSDISDPTPTPPTPHPQPLPHPPTPPPLPFETRTGPSHRHLHVRQQCDMWWIHRFVVVHRWWNVWWWWWWRRRWWWCSGRAAAAAVGAGAAPGPPQCGTHDVAHAPKLAACGAVVAKNLRPAASHYTNVLTPSPGSFQFEAIDATQFANWGFDFIKHVGVGVWGGRGGEGGAHARARHTSAPPHLARKQGDA
jgi:hypothetical protein